MHKINEDSLAVTYVGLLWKPFQKIGGLAVPVSYCTFI